MRRDVLTIAGVAIGFAAGFGAASVWWGLDYGTALTYAHAEQETLRLESDVLRRMAEPYWLDRPAEEALAELEDLALLDFEKEGEGFAAGPVFLVAEGGTISEIRAHCARMPTEDCGNEGVD